MAAGSNITLTDDTTNKKITIAATDTTYGIATYNTSGLVKPWYSHTAASTGPTTGSDNSAIAVNTISTTAGRYYAIEMDSNGRMFVNVPWSSGSSGSSVTWNQSQTTGLQIATVTVDGTTTDVYTTNEKLIGTTANTTPSQVLAALQAGKTVYITYNHELYGTIAATYFDYSNAFSVIISNVITVYYDDEQTTYMLFQLSGYLNNNTWGCHVTTLAEKSDIPSVPTTASSATTGITATTTANTTTVSSHSTDYGVKSAGSGSFTSGAFFGGSFTQGTDSFTANTPTVIDTSKFNGGSGSFTQGSFDGGSGSFSATVTSHVLSFSHTHTAATHGADSHTHTGASLGTGFYSAGTAASFTQGDDTFSPATHGADSHTHTAPTLGSKVPTVSTASATVSITDPGHTHTLA